MKILLMEKFDGISSQLTNWNGRDPSITFSASGAPVMSASDGLTHFYNGTASNGTYITRLYCNLIPQLDDTKKYSFIFNGLKTGARVTQQASNPSTNEARSMLGVTFDALRAVYRGVGTHPFSGVTGNTGSDPFNLEMVYSDGKFDVYVDGLHKTSMPGDLTGNVLIECRRDSYLAGSWSGTRPLSYGGPEVFLKELIILELDEGERRAGNVRLERLKVKSVSENLPDPDNVTPVHLANQTYSTLGEEEVSITMEVPSIKKNELVLGVDYRIAAKSSTSGSQMKVRVNDGIDDVRTEILNLPQGANRSSMCNVIPAIHGGEKSDDYSKYTLIIAATEIEEEL